MSFIKYNLNWTLILNICNYLRKNIPVRETLISLYSNESDSISSNSNNNIYFNYDDPLY